MLDWLESVETQARFMPMVPLMICLDGRSFHSFTEGLDRPFDSRLVQIMRRLTKELIKETNAIMGYTQSDEITLCLYSDNPKSQIYFDGRRQKILSSVAAFASVAFQPLCVELLPLAYWIKAPTFDARAWSVPNKEEAVAAFQARESDATRNAVQMAARAWFSHNACQDKSCAELQEMLFQQRNINFNDYPNFFKRGTWVGRKKIMRKLTSDELEQLPPLHNARKNPDMEFERSQIGYLDMPIFSKVVNPVEVVFNGATPVVKE